MPSGWRTVEEADIMHLARLSVVTLIAIPLFLLGGPTTVGACSPVYEGMEVTQAIQHFQTPPSPDNSVALVDGRATAVRVYVHSAPGCGDIPVTGRLRILEATTIRKNLNTPDNGTITAHEDPPGPDRNLENDTLNFTFILRALGSPPPTSGSVSRRLV